MVSFIPPASFAPKRHGATASGSHCDAFHRTSPTFPGSQALSDISESISRIPEELSDVSESISRTPEIHSDISETISRIPETLSDISESISRTPEELSDVSEDLPDRGNEPPLMRARQIASFLIKRDRFATFAE